MRPAILALAGLILAPSAYAADATSEPTPAPATTTATEPEKTPFMYAFHGFVRAGYFYIPYNKDSSSYVGHGSGFELLNARLAFTGSYSRFFDFNISIDNRPALDRSNNAATDALLPIQINFADVYVTGYLGAFHLRLGQFKTPFNGEFLLDDAYVPFARRSAITEGASVIEAPVAFHGLLLDRELGLMFGGTFPIGEKNHFDFDVAAVNGNGVNQGLNDNMLPAVVGRASGTFGPATVGVAGYWNARTTGLLGTQQDETDLAAEGDVLLNFNALKIFGMFAVKQTSYPTLNGTSTDNAHVKPDSAMGGVVSASYTIDTPMIQYEPAARFSYYVPTTVADKMQVMDTTLGLNVAARAVPVRLQLNYTLRRHDASRQVPDDLAELALQGNF